MHRPLPIGVVPHGASYAAIIHEGRKRHYLVYTNSPEQAAEVYQSVRFLLSIGYLTFDALPKAVSLLSRPGQRRNVQTLSQRAKALGLHRNTIYQRAKAAKCAPEEILTELEKQQMSLSSPTLVE